MTDYPKIGEALIRRADDGTRTVEHADPVIRVSTELLTAMDLDADVIEPDGALRLDSAGEYRYRFLREEDPNTLLYERITDV